MEELGPTAWIVWKLARNHTWGQPIPEEDVIALATKDEDGDEMRAALDAALELSFLTSGPHGVTFQTAKQNTRKPQTGSERTQSCGNTKSRRHSLDYRRSGRIREPPRGQAP